jgi:hypothetical protein
MGESQLTEEGNQIKQTEPWNEIEVKLPQEFSVLDKQWLAWPRDLGGPTYDLLALFFAQMRVRVWDFLIDNTDGTFFEALLVVRGRFSAVGVAMSLDVRLLCHVGGS